MTNQFIQVGFRSLRPSFIHGFYVLATDTDASQVQVYYDGSWISVTNLDSADACWDFVKRIQGQLVRISGN